ncbi:MAG: hypothetical protein N3B68_11775 [Anaerolineae bacterium]|nr:hypothetical protein [Anaerolineae bacterium]
MGNIAADNIAMAQNDVHYDLTKQWVLEVIGNRLGSVGAYVAELIARGNAFVDVFSIFALTFYPLLHFSSWRTARWFVERAIATGHPYIFGATLHQVQDWFTHCGEGYRFLVDGIAHYRHYIKYCLRTSRLIAGFYSHRPRPQLEALLSALYPGVSFDQFTDGELLDLYLREGRLATWEEREQYGYFSDRYYDHTRRDQAMKRWTQHLTWRFVERVVGDVGSLSRVLRGEYRPSIAVLMGFYAATSLALLTL